MNKKKNLTLEKTFNLALQNPNNNLEAAENLYKEIWKNFKKKKCFLYYKSSWNFNGRLI